MNDMTEMLEEALLNGSLWHEHRLAYPPGAYAEKEELYQLCKVLKKHDGIYATHMRDEGRHIIDSVKEVIWLGKETGCRVHICHLKVCGLKNFSLSQEIFELLDQAERDGVRISADAYPYTMSGYPADLLSAAGFDGRRYRQGFGADQNQIKAAKLHGSGYCMTTASTISISPVAVLKR